MCSYPSLTANLWASQVALESPHTGASNEPTPELWDQTRESNIGVGQFFLQGVVH